MNEKATDTPLSYKDAGVDIDAGAALVERIKPAVKKTHRDGVMSGLGGFGGLFSLDLGRFQDPVLVSGTDGVGTKLMLARAFGRHDTIGIDLVAMCVNDIVVTGAEPLFFLDYFATGALDVEAAADVITGIATGCEQAGCALIGGETAEMPGMYGAGEYDLAGFSVGAVNRSDIIDQGRVQAGDVIIGLPSSGAHSNGYSLIRKVVERAADDHPESLDGQPFEDALLAPTRIYVKSLLGLFNAIDVHGVAHITGGGITENLPRILPGNLSAVVDASRWPELELFAWLASVGNIDMGEMRRTFNCGIGMAIVVSETDAEAAMTVLHEHGETPHVIGHIAKGDGSVRYTK
ncbi:MAG: phosphoribosylformylglycinamidine cyclo-ligase [Pseudomonadota bacterium]